MVILPHKRKAFRTPPSSSDNDPFFSSVVLLLHGDGSDNSTIFTDSSSLARTVSSFGDAKIKTDNFKFGGASMRFDGSGDYISTSASSDFDLSSSNWSLEFWFRPNAVIADQRVVTFEISGTTWGLVSPNPGNDLTWNRFGVGSYITASGATASDKLGSWYFISLIKTGGTIEMFIDGISKGTTTTIPSSGEYILRVGGSVSNYATQNLNAWIDDLRFSKVSRENSVPTQAFPNS